MRQTPSLMREKRVKLLCPNDVCVCVFVPARKCVRMCGGWCVRLCARVHETVLQTALELDVAKKNNNKILIIKFVLVCACFLCVLSVL